MADTANTPAAASLGTRLRTARERSGYDRQQAAEKLHCDPSIIDALEGDRLEFLGAPVYVRGHVRRYAELVAESPAEVQELCDQLATQSAATPDLTRIPKGERPADPSSLVRPLLGVGVVLLIAAGTWWVLRGQAPRGLADVVPLGNSVSSEQPVAPPPGPAPAAGSASNSAAGDGAIPGLVAQEHNLSAVLSSPGAAAPAATPGAAASSTPAAAAGSAAAATAAAATAVANSPPAQASGPAGGTQLRVTADMDCWIEAYDSTGKRIYFGMASPQSTQQITGSAPLHVLLGNVRSVKFEVDGKLTTIPDSVRRGTSAWFAVTADGQIKPTAELPAGGTTNDTRKPRSAAKPTAAAKPAGAAKPANATRNAAKTRSTRP